MYSIEGYKRNSPDRNNPFNIIPSGRISMKGVDFPVIGVDEFGIIQFMQPEKEYKFPGNTVFEVPIMQRGGWLRKAWEDFVQDVSTLPSRDEWEKAKSVLNPKNWGVPDYSDKGSKDAAYVAARKAGEKEFMWNNQRFNTKSDMSPEQQLKVYGITDEQLQSQNEIKKRLYKNLTPVSNHSPIKRVWDAVIKNEKDPFRDKISLARSDAYNLYTGHPQTNNTFNISKYKPSISSDNNITYYSLNNDNIKDRLLNLVSEAEDIKKYIDFIRDKNLPLLDNFSGRENVMGKFFPSIGEDINGKYIAYYDKWDINPLNLHIPFTNKEITTDFGKPFEIYDRIYYRDNPNYNHEVLKKLKEELKYAESLKTEYDLHGNPIYKDINNNIVTLPNNIEYLMDYQNKLKNEIKHFPKRYIRQYYSDKELSELDVNKKNFDTRALQIELSNRGYKLPKSTKKDGSFDGVWGDETKNALLDWQNKNLRTSQQKYQQGGWLRKAWEDFVQDVSTLPSRDEWKKAKSVLYDFPPARKAWEDFGSLLPDKVKSVLNPKNWGVPDYSDKGSKDAA
ncbi:MAG TPA: peptidoglycan-binding domain-containing protein, partial [Candidatus Diapherotrites archaeon]|nr:peptidoglycan-binding domain-containing protein [Candidatus Diapherotrites archaeon]